MKKFTMTIPGAKGLTHNTGDPTELKKYAGSCRAECQKAIAHLREHFGEVSSRLHGHISEMEKEFKEMESSTPEEIVDRDSAYEMVEAIDKLIARKKEDISLLSRIRYDEILPVNGLGETIQGGTSWR